MKKEQDHSHHVDFSKLKRTKIIATIGPSTNSYDLVLQLIKAGANGLRLNFSHATHEGSREQIGWIRKASKELGKPVAIIQDLQGPKIRLGDFEGFIPVTKDQQVRFAYNANYEESGIIPTQYDLSAKVKRGERVLLCDGKIATVVTSVKDSVVYAKVSNDGILLKRKGINLPDTEFGGDIITDKDRKDIAFGSTMDIDYVALSFLQTATDMQKLRVILRNLGSKAKTIAKVETAAAVQNIEEIIQEADVVMIARGDLAIETPPESVPVMQRKIIGLGQYYHTPTIVATQMMASMTESPEPTRAEVSDIATAVLVGADCVMLSDETASGKYPIEAVKIMKRVIRYTEGHMPLHVQFEKQMQDLTKQEAICHAAIELSEKLEATAIVAETKSGATAIQLASRRPNKPIIAITSQPLVANQLAIVFGVKSYVRPDDRQASTKLTNWLKRSNVLRAGDVIVTASGQYPGVVGTTDTIKVRVL